MTERVDEHIVSVLNALENSPYKDNTVIVFTSDHGESVAAHRLVVKVTPYEEALSVPMVVLDPRRPELGGTVNHEWHVSGIDLAPTFLELAGLAPEPQHIGRSIAPALDGNKDPRGYLVAEVFPSRENPEASARSIRKGPWKYTVCHSDYGFEEQLINLEQDPGELHNCLQNGEAYAINQRREMLASLLEWLDLTNDPFPRDKLSELAGQP
jgi:choline-sulfatase